MVTSPVEICNMALNLLKAPPITSLDDPNNEVERTCVLWYNTTRKQILRQHPWNFAKARTTLSLASEAPAFGYTDKYALPIDFLRLRFIGDELDSLQNTDYDLEENRYLLINNGGVTSLNIGYIKDVDNVSLYDPLFINCLALTLAVNMSYGVTGKSTVRTDLRNMLNEANIQARAINGQDRPPIRITRSNVIGARRQYGGSGGANISDPTRVQI